MTTTTVDLIVAARRAEARWAHLGMFDYEDANPEATDRLEAVLGAVIPIVVDHLQHRVDVAELTMDDYWKITRILKELRVDTQPETW